MEIQKVKIEEIKPRPKNPKKHWEEGLEKSIKEMGYVEPIVVDENNVILVGHGRLKALKKIGTKEVEVIVKRGLTEKQKERYMLLSNKIGERGGWDIDLLAEFDEKVLLGTGWESEELDEIFHIEEPKETEIDEGLLITNKCPKCGYEW